MAKKPDTGADILREQFEFLLDHAGAHCDLLCEECRRFDLVRGALMLPYVSAPCEVPHPPKKANARAKRARRANA